MNLTAAVISLTGVVTGFSAPAQIDNPYLPLSKWKSCDYRGKADDGTRERSVKTLLDRTRAFTIDGQRVEAAVIEDRAFEDGELVERTLDYFAEGDDGTVFYLGEHVANIRARQGREPPRQLALRQAHRRARRGDAAEPAVGRPVALRGRARHHDRVESRGGDRACARACGAAGSLFTDVIRVQEFIQPEGDVEYKLYAPGIGLIAEYPPDARVVLHRCR